MDGQRRQTILVMDLRLIAPLRTRQPPLVSGFLGADFLPKLSYTVRHVS